MNGVDELVAHCSHVGRVAYGGACECVQAELEERLRI